MIPHPSRRAVESATAVTVALPVHRDHATLGAAVSDITAQTLGNLEILLILNGADPETRAVAMRAARDDPRVRVLALETPSLARALNLALREARHDLIARMDADDRCPPVRLELQSAFLLSHPDAGAVGCAWEMLDDAGARLAVVRPPTDPRAMRWRLLIENPLAHGSMMVRRSVVRAAGGYDERLDRAQDYELWTRLARVAPIAALPDLLYTHRLRNNSGSLCRDPVQSAAASGIMAREWASLESLTPSERHTLSGLLAQAMAGTEGEEAVAHIEEFLTRHGPSREALMAYLWARDRLPPMSRRAVEACRRARLREVGDMLRREGATSVILWGGGTHAGWILRHEPDLDIPITGIVDDDRAGTQQHGMHVQSPDDLRPGDHVLIASDAHEEAIWNRSETVRAAGVAVHRLYGGQPAVTTYR